ncbi:hypothetical protein [Nakamurella panacisegetis]|uniref:hypothetical protein n=1 Tax=Nakamurella panacisegetis TaxID=1090615 RepID=UPI0012FD05C4|nr:hypothetical protein [Nakamurella panacisegetis]
MGKNAEAHAAVFFLCLDPISHPVGGRWHHLGGVNRLDGLRVLNSGHDCRAELRVEFDPSEPGLIEGAPELGRREAVGVATVGDKGERTPNCEPHWV